MNKFFETVEEYLKNSNMTKDEKVAFIKAAGDFYRQQVDKEYNNYVRNQQIGAGIEIASAAIPGSTGVKAAAKIAPCTNTEFFFFFLLIATSISRIVLHLQDFFLFSFHNFTFVIIHMIISHQMEHTVSDQKRKFPASAMTIFLCLCSNLVHGNHNISKQKLTAFGIEIFNPFVLQPVKLSRI